MEEVYSLLCLLQGGVDVCLPVHPEEMILPKNLKLLTISMGELSIRRGTTGDFSLRKSMIISFVFDMFSSRWLFQHQDTKRLTSWRYEDSSEFSISPSTMVSSANLMSWTEEWWEMQLLVKREYRRGDRTHPWQAPVFRTMVDNWRLLSLTD